MFGGYSEGETRGVRVALKMCLVIPQNVAKVHLKQA